MYCCKCGKEIEDTSTVCSYCGSPVNNISEQTEKAIEPEVVTENGTTNVAPKAEKKNWLVLIGMLATVIGIIGFTLIVMIGLLFYGRVYFYNGYGFTAVCCTLVIIFSFLGSGLIIAGLVIERIKLCFTTDKRYKKASIVLAVLAVIFAIILLGQIPAKSSSSSSSSHSSSSSSTELTHAQYCMLYMKVSNVTVTHSGNYTYVRGKIKNNGTYSVRYVKVKASCKNYSGTVIDTDWTYAVDSSWLEPGESNSFEMMIRDESNQIKKADVTVVYE